MIDPKQIDALLHPQFDAEPAAVPSRSARACPPRRVPLRQGRLHRRRRRSGWQRGEKVLLVRKETNPEDIEGMHPAVGILTAPAA